METLHKPAGRRSFVARPSLARWSFRSAFRRVDYQRLAANSFMHFAVTATLIYFFVRFEHRDTIRPFSASLNSALEIILSLASINLLVLVIDLATQRSRLARSALQIALLFLLWLGNTYYLTTHVPPDFALIADNLGIAFSSARSLGVIWTSFTRSHLIATFAVAIAAVVLEIRYLLISRVHYGRRPLLTLLGAAFFYAAMVVMPVQSYDPLTSLAQDAYRRALPDPLSSEGGAGFPYMKDRVEISGMFSRSPAERPDIFLVMIESFNANFVEARTPAGREITPVMNRLVHQGRYYDRFYGNSIQTAKGQEAVLLSITPPIKGKIATNYPYLNFKSLPACLTEAGYDTVFMQGAEDLSFDNAAQFMKRAGFADVRTAFEFLTPQDRSRVWGWGVEDELLYEKFFRYLAQREAQQSGKPVFALLATIANHMRFDDMPADKKLLYPLPAHIQESYANSIHLSDMHLEELLALVRARNRPSVIIITGDHSFPMGEHNYVHNENGYFDESFRTPFLVLYPGKIAPERVSSQAYSQVDIAPTILDLAGVSKVKQSFTGRSIFLEDEESRPVYLVQPYHGVYLESVRYPWKYIYHRKTGDAYLYNLEQDPRETNNLIGSAPVALVADMKKDIDAIVLNQHILERNALYRIEDRGSRIED